MQNRCVIVGGADIGNYEYIRKQLRKDDFIIFCDCGLRHQIFEYYRCGKRGNNNKCKQKERVSQNYKF